MKKELLLAIFFYSVTILIALSFRPIMTIDETRYIGVAWEMYQKHSFILPLLNGAPYDHKFPLLFWLVHLTWALFGVNEWNFRIIPLLFGIGNLVLTFIIYKALFKDEKGAILSVWILSSSALYAFYNSLFMFDVILGFWVLLALFALVQVVFYQKNHYFWLLSFAIFMGVLTKGPVIGLFLLPLFLCAKCYYNASLKFYVQFALFGALGLFASLLWIVPAIIQGGAAYGKALLLKQSIGRAIHSFAHKRPIYWYIPIFIAFATPWILQFRLFKSIKILFKEKEFSFLAIFVFGSFLLLSLISGKQVHYLIPTIPTLSMLFARALCKSSQQVFSARVFGSLIIVIAIAFFFAPKALPKDLSFLIDYKAIAISTILLLSYGIFLFIKKFQNKVTFAKILALNTFFLLFSIHYIAHKYLKMQDLHAISKTIADYQNKGYTIAHFGKYADEFHFQGRLKKDLLIFYSQKKLKHFLQSHPKTLVIIHLKRQIPYPKNLVLAKGKLRTTNILLIKREYFLH